MARSRSVVAPSRRCERCPRDGSPAKLEASKGGCDAAQAEDSLFEMQDDYQAQMLARSDGMEAGTRRQTTVRAERNSTTDAEIER